MQRKNDYKTLFSGLCSRIVSCLKKCTSGESNKSVKRLMARAGLRNPVIVNVAIASTKKTSSSVIDLDDDIR